MSLLRCCWSDDRFRLPMYLIRTQEETWGHKDRGKVKVEKLKAEGKHEAVKTCKRGLDIADAAT